MIQGGVGKKFPDEHGLLAAGDDLVDYHLRIVEAHQIHAPSLRYILFNQAYSLLSNPGGCGRQQQTYHVVDEPFVTIRLVGDLFFCQHHHIIITELNRPKGLGGAEALAVADALRTTV